PQHGTACGEPPAVSERVVTFYEQHHFRAMNEHFCACGCGQPTNLITHTVRTRGMIAGEYYRFLPGHNARLQPCPATTYRSKAIGPKKARALHLIRAEQALGKPLPPKAIVHHVDEDPSNPNARLVI